MGMLVAVPYITMAMVLQFAGIMADTLRGRYKIKTGTVLNTLKKKVSTADSINLTVNGCALSFVFFFRFGKCSPAGRS